MKTQQDASGWALWLEWIVANTLAAGMGAVLVWSILNRMDSTSTAHPEYDALAYLAAGILAGVLQWLVLRQFVSKVGWWIVTTPIALAGGVALLAALFGIGSEYTGRDTVASLLAGAMAAGVFTGLVQWLVLHRHIPHAAWWVLASAPAVFVSIVVFLFTTLGGHAYIPQVLAGAAVGGALYGIVTGASLVLLVRHHFPWHAEPTEEPPAVTTEPPVGEIVPQ